MKKLFLLRTNNLDDKIDLLVRSSIKQYSDYIMEQLHDAKKGTIFSLDLNQVEAINASGTDEIIVRSLKWLQDNIKNHDKYLFIENLSPPAEYDHAYNIIPVLEHTKVCVMAKETSTYNYLGYLGGTRDSLKKVLDFVYSHKIATAKDVAKEINKHVNTTSTQLAQLYKMRLIQREEEILPEGGRIFIYKSLF